MPKPLHREPGVENEVLGARPGMRRAPGPRDNHAPTCVAGHLLVLGHQAVIQLFVHNLGAGVCGSVGAYKEARVALACPTFPLSPKGTLKVVPTSALHSCVVCLHSQGCQGQAQQCPQEHAQDRGHGHAPRHCCQWGNAAGDTCRDGQGQREAGIRTAAGAGVSGHGQSHLCKHPCAGSCYLQLWWPRSCPRCPRHRRCG